MIIIRKFSRDEARAAAKMLNAFDQKRGETTKSILEKNCQGVFNGSKRITGLIEYQDSSCPSLYILRPQDDNKKYAAIISSRLRQETKIIIAFSR